jgi:hypothetical protein
MSAVSMSTVPMSAVPISTVPMNTVPMSTVPMNTVSVFIPQAAISPAHTSDMPRKVATPRTAAGPTRCQLTDRGIAVVMVVAAIIMIAALAVIGLTAVRVTGAG